jgi:hypothetical protein
VVLLWLGSEVVELGGYNLVMSEFYSVFGLMIGKVEKRGS